jgi:hypothetical protein
MKYTLKEKITITEDFLTELISKSWQETEAIQQQIANIDTSTKLGTEVVELLKNTCTNHYVLIGCLEALLEKPEAVEPETAEQPVVRDSTESAAIEREPIAEYTSYEGIDCRQTIITDNFEPFEYFVDFDEPSGEPLSDKDLYG